MPEVGTQYYLGSNPIQVSFLGNQPVAFNPYEAPSVPYVTNGLILYMDSTEPASYPGSGTSWFNLVSGQPYVGTLGSAVTYTGGYLQTVSTTNGDITITTSSFASGTYTIMSATRYTDTSANGRMLASISNNWLSGQWQNTTENYYAEGWVYGAGGGANDTNWRIYTATGDTAGDKYSYYINGINVALDNTGGAAGPNGLTAGSWGGSERSDGQIAFVMIYNRVLSQAEVTQNYNALKSKVGL